MQWGYSTHNIEVLSRIWVDNFYYVMPTKENYIVTRVALKRGATTIIY